MATNSQIAQEAKIAGGKVAKKRSIATSKIASARRKAKVKTKHSSDGVLHKGRQAMSDAYHWAGERTSHLPDMRSQLHRVRSVQTIINENPVVLGAIGLGIGVLLGALLPHGNSHNTRH